MNSQDLSKMLRSVLIFVKLKLVTMSRRACCWRKLLHHTVYMVMRHVRYNIRRTHKSSELDRMQCPRRDNFVFAGETILWRERFFSIRGRIISSLVRVYPFKMSHRDGFLGASRSTEQGRLVTRHDRMSEPCRSEMAARIHNYIEIDHYRLQCAAGAVPGGRGRAAPQWNLCPSPVPPPQKKRSR